MVPAKEGRGMRKFAVRAVLVITAMVLLVAGALAQSASADPTNAITKARPIVDANVGDVPAPNEEGILNNLDNLPTAAFNSTTRNPVCTEYTGAAPTE
jgi:hypothetical protein